MQGRRGESKTDGTHRIRLTAVSARQDAVFHQEFVNSRVFCELLLKSGKKAVFSCAYRCNFWGGIFPSFISSGIHVN
jgi:hypothetical protein